MGSKSDLLKFQDKYGEEIRCPNTYPTRYTTLKQRRFNVDSTQDVESTLNRHCFNVVCPLGKVNVVFRKIM